jgi:hypothetical protein
VASHSRSGTSGTADNPGNPVVNCWPRNGAIERPLSPCSWALPRDEFARLGSQYLDIAARHRKTEKTCLSTKCRSAPAARLIRTVFPRQ